jgi:membrane-bound inhibitor of C-type lysozyme
MKNYIIGGVLVLFIIVGASVTLMQKPYKEESVPVTTHTMGKAKGFAYDFICKDNKKITATFYPSDDIQVDLVLSDGRSFTLPHAMSASGARYANEDESLVFWEKGDIAFLEEKGVTTFNECNTNLIHPEAEKGN